MASYQDSSYGPRSTYAGPTNNANANNAAGHFPQSHHQNQQQHSLYYPNHPNPNPTLNPNPYPPPHSNHHSNQSNDPSPPPPHHFAPSYPNNPQPSEGHAYYPQRQAYHPNLNQNGRTPLMQLPTGLPDDHFKKPYLPQQQQYMNHGPPPANFTDHHQQQRAISDLAPAQPYPGASTPSKRLHTSSSSYPPISTTMSMTAAPINPPSAHSTPTSEVPSQSADPVLQPGGLSSLDQQRVDALLQVNNLLLQEVTTLQKLGLKPSPQSPQPTVPPNNSSSPQATPAPPASTGDPAAPNAAQTPNNNAATKPNATATTPTTTTTPTTATAPPLQQQSLNAKKYVEFMTRLKTNIVFLVSISDQAKDKPRLPYPSHLESPPLWLNPGTDEGDRQLDLLREEYARLRGLWPDWKPEARKLQVGGGQQQQQQAQQQAGQQQQMMQQQPQVQQQS